MTTNTGFASNYSRRELLALAGAGTAGLVLASCGSSGSDSTDATSTSAAASSGSTPSCVLTPEETEGPFYTNVDLIRRDITEGRPGAPLDLRIKVVGAGDCQPISDATVDIWHADATGLYSAFTGQGDDESIDTSSETFLRGIQKTDAAGEATFSTIYPGWYMGRTTHIHVKVHLGNQTQATTQLYFPDETTNAVYADGDAYASRGAKDTSNDADGVSASGSSLLMTVSPAGGGYQATHTIGIAST